MHNVLLILYTRSTRCTRTAYDPDESKLFIFRLKISAPKTVSPFNPFEQSAPTYPSGKF